MLVFVDSFRCFLAIGTPSFRPVLRLTKEQCCPQNHPEAPFSPMARWSNSLANRFKPMLLSWFQLE